MLPASLLKLHHSKITSKVGPQLRMKLDLLWGFLTISPQILSLPYQESLALKNKKINLDLHVWDGSIFLQIHFYIFQGTP